MDQWDPAATKGKGGISSLIRRSSIQKKSRVALGIALVQKSMASMVPVVEDTAQDAHLLHQARSGATKALPPRVPEQVMSIDEQQSACRHRRGRE